MKALPKDVQALLKTASTPSPHNKVRKFRTTIFGNEWDQFVEEWAPRVYAFVEQALGDFPIEPLEEILAISPGHHSGGVNASFNPVTGQVRLCPSVVEGKPGATLEKLTHEFTHAALNDFPEGGSFHEEGAVDYSVWVMAHAPVWEPYRREMVHAAEYNIKCRKDRALGPGSNSFDIQRWCGGMWHMYAHGPWIVEKFRMKKIEKDFTWR